MVTNCDRYPIKYIFAEIVCMVADFDSYPVKIYLLTFGVWLQNVTMPDEIIIYLLTSCVWLQIVTVPDPLSLC